LRLLTSVTRLVSHSLKLGKIGFQMFTVSAMLRELHCCTACRQSQHAQAAAHRTFGSELHAGCSKATLSASSFLSCKGIHGAAGSTAAGYEQALCTGACVNRVDQRHVNSHAVALNAE
jgi:hypothetical protein